MNVDLETLIEIKKSAVVASHCVVVLEQDTFILA